MQTSTKQLSAAWQICLLMLFIAVTIAMPDLAFADVKSDASSDTVIATVFCNIIKWFTGTTGKGIATIAVIIIGIGALMGKVSWGMAIIVGIGVALIFGAASLVNSIAGNQENPAGCGDI